MTSAEPAGSGLSSGRTQWHSATSSVLPMSLEGNTERTRKASSDEKSRKVRPQSIRIGEDVSIDPERQQGREDVGRALERLF